MEISASLLRKDQLGAPDSDRNLNPPSAALSVSAYLQDQVGDEGVCFVLRQVVVLPVQHGEQQLQVLQNFHQDGGVGLKEAKRDPFQDQVQTADGGVAFAVQPLSDRIQRSVPEPDVLKTQSDPQPPTSIMTPMAFTCLWKSR